MKHHTARSQDRGAALLEVVLALVLFVGAAAVVTGGMNAALNSVERIRLNIHAANLAVSVMSELQMGARSLQASGPADFDPPFDEWSWEIQTEPMAGEFGRTNALKRVEVIIRHTTPPMIVHRLCQIIEPVEPLEATTTASASQGQAPAVLEREGGRP